MLCLSVRWGPRPAPRICLKRILHEGRCEATMPSIGAPQMALLLTWERSVEETVADRQRVAGASSVSGGDGD